MPHKPKPNIFNGITQAEGILENSAADTRMTATIGSSGTNMVRWAYGRNYDNNVYTHASVDYYTGKIVTLYDNVEPLERSEVQRMDQTFSYFLATGRRKPKRIKQIVKEEKHPQSE